MKINKGKRKNTENGSTAGIGMTKKKAKRGTWWILMIVLL